VQTDFQLEISDLEFSGGIKKPCGEICEDIVAGVGRLVINLR